jgi:hypothetical protein
VSKLIKELNKFQDIHNRKKLNIDRSKAKRASKSKTVKLEVNKNEKDEQKCNASKYKKSLRSVKYED